ncbi:MAG TPA: BON domain-containing protein [Acidobacteriaceae bacterium]|nr:BON domain-containing protein [Acidobacteriaceae bacterium]
MKRIHFSAVGAICSTSILGLGLLGGCNNNHALKQWPDEVDSVNHALVVNGFNNVQVAQNRTTGVMTLTGTVASPDLKTQASKIASINASDYTITNALNVTAPAAQTASTSDDAIKDKYEAMLKAHKNLDHQGIDYKVDHGTILLSGRVRRDSERSEAVKLAKSVPNVQNVVDQIKVQS